MPVATLVWLHLDDDLPALSQLAGLRKLHPDSLVIVLANQPDDGDALSLFSAGVSGYCNAHATVANLRQVANVVKAGGLWIGETLMKRLLASTQSALSRISGAALSLDEAASDSNDPMSTLTKREQEVARSVANGSSNKEVARELGITERTVKAHVGSVFKKLNVRDRLQLVLIVNGRRQA
ncbi:MAG: response regulator transcription factor [Burkholderiaceae bacterium]|nr:response regulator transcription factor [Sulfuritalea sp.]MCF8174685.1 response regulator transcription factor [Burkholderiaceae bacterium]